jgi:hypothetical protein
MIIPADGRSERWVKLYVRLQENPIWTDLPASALKVFIACLFKANYKDLPFYDGKRAITIPRGSFVLPIA